MGKLIDLSGKTIGLLTVIKQVESKKAGRPMWLCQCKCGNITIVSSTNLTKANGAKSCGCLRHKPSSTLIDLTGKVFGKLTVLQRDTVHKYRKVKWICQCECGTIVSVFSSDLRSGKTKSCGCSKFQLKYNLVGQTFGFLLVTEPVSNAQIKSNEIRWKCLCQNCGRTVEVSSYLLRHSNPYGHCKCTRFNKL